MENGVTGEGEDGHEEVSNHRADRTSYNSSRDRGGYRPHRFSIFSCLGQNGEYEESIGTSDEEHSENHVDRSDSRDSSETSSVHQDQGEGLEGTGAEVAVGEGDLNVGVLSEELNTFLEADKAVSSNTQDSLGNLIASSPSLDVFAVVLEEESDELADSNAESTEGNRAKMLGEEPFDRGQNGGLDQGVTLGLEEPDAGGACNNELATSNDKGVHPEESEDLVEENVSGLAVPLNFSYEWESFTGLRLSNRENPQHGNEPGNNPHDEDNHGHKRLKEDSKVRLCEVNCSFENGNTKSEGLETAAEDAKDNSAESPSGIGTV